MNKRVIASELLVLARELLSMDFLTQDAFDKYLKDHPDANRSNHKVVKTPDRIKGTIKWTRPDRQEIALSILDGWKKGVLPRINESSRKKLIDLYRGIESNAFGLSPDLMRRVRSLGRNPDVKDVEDFFKKY